MKLFRRIIKLMLLAIAALVVLVILIGATLGYMFSAPGYTGEESDHFDGERFVNRDTVTTEPGLRAILKFTFQEKRAPWPDWIDNTDHPPPPARVGNGDLRVTFINHATTLIQMDGLNILTDPIWSERCSPVFWAGPRRHRAPGVTLENLPPLDAILISHNHYDHCDIPTLRRLSAAHPHARVIVGLGVKAMLAHNVIANIQEIDWEDSLSLSDVVALRGVTAKHFSGRGFFDRNKTLWLGYVISSPAGNVYFAGDTGYGAHFRQIGEKYGPIRLALLPIGAYLPSWFMRPVHISPSEAVDAHRDLGAQTSIAVHFGTFRLGADGETQPADDLRRALSAHRDVRFWVLDQGEGRDVPAVSLRNGITR
ncbi:MAG TPA: MBL fold metallo-hydrolase [candidate division Zixibacteria bacterium]|jgi:L-ascorbate metabolism protein UlaG (beta-lactamase superfamily)